MTRQRKFKVGDRVRLKRGALVFGLPPRKGKGWRRTSTIGGFFADIDGFSSGVWLDDMLDGFFAWNLEDLELVPEREMGGRSSRRTQRLQR